jgi:hypothetical protein
VISVWQPNKRNSIELLLLLLLFGLWVIPDRTD